MRFVWDAERERKYQDIAVCRTSRTRSPVTSQK